MATETNLVIEIRKQQAYLRSFFGDKISILTEVGDFYQAYGSDARLLSQITGYKLSKRDGTVRDSLEMCGFPSERGSFSSVVAKLLENGFIVGLLNQIDVIDDKGRTCVGRKLESILTPGTHFESENPTTLFIQDGKAIFSETFSQREKVFEVPTLDALYEIVSVFNPGEIIVSGDFDTFLKIDFDLSSQFPIFSFPPKQNINESYQEYLRLTVGGSLSNKTQDGNNRMDISLKTLKNLMVFGDRNETSVYSVIDKTDTPFGRRTLKDMLRSPLLDKNLIEARHTIVSKMIGNGMVSIISEYLTKTVDFEVFLTKLVSNRFGADETYAFRNAIASSIELLGRNDSKDVISAVSDAIKKEDGASFDLNKLIIELTAIVKVLDETLSKEYFERGDVGNTVSFLKRGFDKDVDTANDMAISKEKVFEKEEARVLKEFGVDGKIKEDKKGKLLFQTKVTPQKLGEPFTWVTTMKTGDRYSYPELMKMEFTMGQAGDVITCAESRALETLRIEILSGQEAVLGITKLLGFLDVYAGFATLVDSYGYVIPKMSKNESLEIKGMRHVVVASRMFGESYIANDAMFEKDTKGYYLSFMNGGGKSTFLRGVGITMILFQIGCPVLCSSANLYPVDGVFARIGGGDNLLNKESTFVLEMKELKEILDLATHSSLVLLDEVGRGTDNKSGLAIAKATMEYFINKGAKFIFASHYHELVEIVKRSHSVKSLIVEEVFDENGDIRFSYAMKEGYSDTSHGYEVAKIMKLSKEVLDLAKTYL